LTAASALPDLRLKSTKFRTIFFKTLDFTPRFLYTGKQAAFLQFGTLKIEPPPLPSWIPPFERGSGRFQIRPAVLWPPELFLFVFFWKTIHPPAKKPFFHSLSVKPV
jgi:hypothetical protein